MSGQGQVGELLEKKNYEKCGEKQLTMWAIGENNQQCELLGKNYDQCAMSELRNFRSINIMDEGNSQPRLQWIEAGREFEDIFSLDKDLIATRKQSSVGDERERR